MRVLDKCFRLMASLPWSFHQLQRLQVLHIVAPSTSMASLPWIPSKTQQEDEEDERSYRRHSDLISTLPEDHRWVPLRKFQGFWFFEAWLPGILASREHFVARPSDIFLACFPKSGTTWLKSIVFSVVHRDRHPPHDDGHPMRRDNPHDVVYFLDELYRRRKNPDLSALPSPRIFSTHSPYTVLPESVKNSGCRIVYVARETKDNFVSRWHFSRGLKLEGIPPISMHDQFDMFCSGVSNSGPIWEHVLEYWNERLRRPDKVLFLKYAAMKEDPVGNLKNLAAFLGCPFSADEEERGVPEGISEFCSFRNLSNTEVNKDGVLAGRNVEKKLFFRRGEVGDWVNHLSPEMAEKLDRITQEKLQGTGLNFY